MTRSLQYTISSIQKNVFDKLEEAGFEYHVYLHTYNLDRLESTRSGTSSALNKTEWKLLNPDFHSVTKQVGAITHSH